MKEISSLSISPVFRSYSVIIIILVLFFIFLQYAENVEKDFEMASVGKTVNEINSLLTVLMMEKMVVGKLDDLALLDGSNPFTLFNNKYQITNYYGEVKSDADIVKKRGWYFNVTSHDVLFQTSLDDEYLVFKVKLYYDDLNLSGEYERGVDKVQIIKLERKSPV